MDKEFYKNHTFVVCTYKESKYLEECVISLMSQTIKSNILIATSTPNEFINNIAQKYNIKVVENPKKGMGIGYDFDFALSVGQTQFVTIAHQDDLYVENYLEEVVKKINDKTIICFTDYSEKRNDRIVHKNRNLKIKRFMLWILNYKIFQKSIFIRRRILSLGDPICCPSVTFNMKQTKIPLFYVNYKSNVDWFAWEKLSKQKGFFVYINKKLMMHRIHEESETTKIINDNIRTNEDFEIFIKFWPKFIAKILAKIYKRGEQSNSK